MKVLGCGGRQDVEGHKICLSRFSTGRVVPHKAKLAGCNPNVTRLCLSSIDLSRDLFVARPTNSWFGSQFLESQCDVPQSEMISIPPNAGFFTSVLGIAERSFCHLIAIGHFGSRPRPHDRIFPYLGH